MLGKSRLISLRLPDQVIRLIDSGIVELNKKARRRLHTRSSWIAECVIRRMEELATRQSRRTEKKFVCEYCGVKCAEQQISYKSDLLTGETVYCCNTCAPNHKPH